MMNNMGWFGGGWGHGLGGVFMLLVWMPIIVGIAALVMWRVRAPREKTPLDVLEQRYARGEIGHEEFERRRRDLSGG